MSIITKLQNLFGVTKAEITILAIILLGLIIGMALKQFSTGDIESGLNSELTELIYSSLDSLAEANRTTYIGTDIRNNPIPELAAGDTVIKKGFFQKAKVKLDASTKINLNTASKFQLMKLPGVGEKTALKIIDYRTQHPFKSPDEIMKIKGIGKKKFDKIKQFIEIN